MSLAALSNKMADRTHNLRDLKDLTHLPERFTTEKIFDYARKSSQREQNKAVIPSLSNYLVFVQEMSRLWSSLARYNDQQTFFAGQAFKDELMPARKMTLHMFIGLHMHIDTKACIM